MSSLLSGGRVKGVVVVLRHRFGERGRTSVGCVVNCANVWVRLCGALASLASNARAIWGRSGWYFVGGVMWERVWCCCGFAASDGEEGEESVGCDVQCEFVRVRRCTLLASLPSNVLANWGCEER